MMSFCTQCDRPCLDMLCASCVEVIELGLDSNGQACYNDRLDAGFALIGASNDPGNYNDHWS